MTVSFTGQSISYETAAALVNAAVTRAHELGMRQVVAVLDENGHLKVIGAIGVGGGTIEQDIACARAGLAALANA